MADTGKSWRRDLILSLGEGAEEQRVIDRRLTIRVVAFVVFAVVGITIAQLLVESAGQSDFLPLAVVFLPSLVVVIAAWVFGFRFLVRMRSGSARDRLLSDPRRPILYLRSFDFERRLPSGLLGSNPEMVLVDRFARVGPVIAIGRPGEHLPPLGAARFYTTDANWQQSITAVCAAAQFVVWVTGTSKGLEWELNHILKAVPKDRVIVVAHPHWISRSEAQRQAEWQQFLSVLGHIFPVLLPQRLGDAWFVHFDSKGGACMADASARTDWAIDRRWHGLHTAIDRLFVDKGLLDPRLLARRKRRGTWLWALFAIGIVLAILGAATAQYLMVLGAIPLLMVVMFSAIKLAGRNPQTLPAPERTDS